MEAKVFPEVLGRELNRIDHKRTEHGWRIVFQAIERGELQDVISRP
ncbi:hypothetical protein [Nonomuraea helvata]|uniref:Uncharacterized protein n=1 Tax=Nonomuraea helvata TaxID=37484 RepID=A0ABV5S5A1_9ACTN